VIQNKFPKICAIYFLQVTEAAEADLHNVSNLLGIKGVILPTTIMSYHNNQGIHVIQLDFRNLPLNNLKIVRPAKSINDEDVEQGVHKLKNFFINKAMSISHWNLHGALKVVVELNLYGSVIYQGFRMR